MVIALQNADGEVSSFKAVNQASMPSASNGEMPHKQTPGQTQEAQSKPDNASAEPAVEAIPSCEAVSQPMTSSTSTSSHQSQKDAAAAAAGPSPYGTRSRNRPGVTRPNYAEDTEIDFELSAPPANGGTGKSAVHTDRTSKSPPNGNGIQSSNPVGKRKKSIVNGTPNSAVSKDADIPGTSTFSAMPDPNAGPTNPKKRKAAHSPSSGKGHAAATQTTSHTTTRRATNAAAVHAHRETNMLFFGKCKGLLKDGKLEADDGTVLAVNDHVYLICEPPGEPYYLCRIMEFVHSEPENPKSPVECIRVNWYYRPRDVLRCNNDTRLVYGTMHSDVCPITSLRGKCHILHRSEIENLEEFRKRKDSFWFNQIFDRFIHRWYEVIPTSQIINVPEKVKKALDERWKYIVVETSRVKELTSAVKLCKRCSGYCATNESVECAVCHNTYHMNCVRPPLLKKPSRGFAWACGPCSRAQERKLEARLTPIIGETAADAEEEEVFEEEEEEIVSGAANTTAPSPSSSDAQVDLHPGTQAEIALAKMWPMRYLGIHCRVEDALQYDDRAIYPRASSRLGPRHQANVNIWHGRPVELVKPADIKKRYVKTGNSKKETKLSKETLAAMEADRAEKARRPKWVQDEPPGYIRRGEDIDNDDPNNTAKLLFSMAPSRSCSTRGENDHPKMPSEEIVDAYMERAKAVAKDIGVKPFSTNFLDKALELLKNNSFNPEAALKQLKKVDRRKDLREPELSKEELKRFEEGIARYGSELRVVRQHVKTISHADTVRFYYMWKKTPKGKEIWGSYGGRKGTKKKVEANAAAKLLDDIADDFDDSAFDNDKAIERKRGFQCKFCSTRKSRQWRRAPGVTPGQTASSEGKASAKDKTKGLVIALCQRCASLWRRYGIKWENIDEVARKVAQGGGKAWKKKMDEEYLQELIAANEASSLGAVEDDVDSHETNATVHHEPPRKKAKGPPEKESGSTATAVEPVIKKKEKPPPPPRPPTPPIVPTLPKFRDLPCAVCRTINPFADQIVTCKDCRLTVHRGCYGIGEERNANKWVCDMCMNDRAPQVSLDYKCVLCTVVETQQDLLEPPKTSHKKKNDREREKERQEKELAVQFLKNYTQKQREKGRPDMPRQALKRTANNNWVHVTCAVWTPEIRFSKATGLEVAEGISRGTIPTARFDQTCKLCKIASGACVFCHHCHSPFHVACAQEADYVFGFDITPVKVSRRDHVSTVTLGTETGSMTAATWCKEHTVKSIVHAMSEVNEDSGLSALQLFVRTYKQADLTFTGTVRKANLVNLSTRAVGSTPAPPPNRRTSTGNSSGQARSRASISGAAASSEDQDHPISRRSSADQTEPKCTTCGVDVSPKWWKIKDASPPAAEVDSAPIAPEGDRQVNGVGHSANSQASSPAAKRTLLPDQASKSTPAPAVQSVSLVKNPATPLSPAVTRVKRITYQCHRCHWKALHPDAVIDEPMVLEDPSKPTSPERTFPERTSPERTTHERTAPGRTSPERTSAMRTLPPAHPSWLTAGTPPQGQGLIWSGTRLPGTNSFTPSGPPAPHLPLPPPFTNSNHGHGHPNGYGPLMPPSLYGSSQVGHGRSTHYAPPRPPPPPPLVLSNVGSLSGLPNGLPSPRYPQHSPTYSATPHTPQQSGSPFQTSPHFVQPYGVRHGSPGSVHNRPTTPRETAMLGGNDARYVAGANAGSSMRNTLR